MLPWYSYVRAERRKGRRRKVPVHVIARVLDRKDVQRVLYSGLRKLNWGVDCVQY